MKVEQLIAITPFLFMGVNSYSTPQRQNLSRKAFLTTTTTTALAIPQIARAEPSGLPAVGTKAPDFALPNARDEGNIVDLKTLLKTGKWTVLYFYPGAFTTGCTLEARGFQRDIEKYRSLNTQIVGVSVDPVEKNAQFCQAEALDFILLSDANGIISKKYGSALQVPGFGSFSNRQTYLIDPKGELRWVFLDVESRVPRHSGEVLEKLRELEA